MKLEEANERREMWGDKPCNHPSLEKEYYMGSQTGDYVCTICGAVGWGKELNKPKNGILSNYEYIGTIGSGSFANVDTYKRKSDKIKFAIKFLLKEHQSNEDYIERFKKEIIITQSLNDCENTIDITDFCLDERNNEYWYAMPKATTNLEKYINNKNSTLKDEERISLFDQILSAIKFAHDRRILHRDLAPSNILLFQEDNNLIVKVADFGLGKDISTGSFANSSIQGYGQILYRAPEQDIKLKNATNKSDIYALGKVLYFIMTGKRPATIQRCKFYEIIIKATQDDPEERYEKIEQFIVDYEQYKKLIIGKRNFTNTNITLKHYLETVDIPAMDWFELYKVVLNANVHTHVYDDFVDPFISFFTFEGGDLDEFFNKINSGKEEIIQKFIEKYKELTWQTGWPFRALNRIGNFLYTLVGHSDNLDVKLMLLKEVWDLGAVTDQWAIQDLIKKIIRLNEIPKEIEMEFAFHMLNNSTHVEFLGSISLEKVKSEPIKKAILEILSRD